MMRVTLATMAMKPRATIAAAAAGAILVVGAGATVGSQFFGSSHQADHPVASSVPQSTTNTTPVAMVSRPGEQIVTLTLPGGDYTPAPPNGGTDDYRCFVLDLPSGASGAATGFEVVPGNKDVTHHAILYRVNPDQVAAAEALDAKDPGEGYECFGGSQVPQGRSGNPMKYLDNSDWLAAWAPGGGPTSTPAGYGVSIPAGGKVVLQMHYNTRKASTPDNTIVRVRLAEPGQQLKPIVTSLLVAPVELPCLPGQTGPKCSRDAAITSVVTRFGNDSSRLIAGMHLICGQDFTHPPVGPTTSCTRTISEPMTLFAVAGHMHKLGRSIQVDVNPDTPNSTRVLDVANYDFDQQGAVPLAQPLQLQAGDRVKVTCTHDQSLRGKLPGVPAEPQYVVWGEGTTDEMCLGVLVTGRG